MMGSVAGSPCFVQSVPMSCSSSSSQSLFPSSHTRHVKTKRNKHRASTMACCRSEKPNEDDCYQRRTILVLGISSLSLLQFKARAVETLVKGEGDIRIQEENQNNEQRSQQEAASNPFLSLLNVVGIIGSGVLGALYTLGQKEKEAKDATIESLNNRLDEKEVYMISMEQKFEKRLLDEQEERTRQIKKVKEDQLSLSNQLTSANNTISGLGQQLLNEKRLVEELKSQFGRLENDLAKSGEDNKKLQAKLQAKLEAINALQDRVNLLTLEINDKEDNLQSLKSSFTEKESECQDLDFMCKHAKGDLKKANMEIESWKKEALKTAKELDSKNSIVNDLHSKIALVATERDNINKKLQSLEEDYKDLKSISENKAASDAELLKNKDLELQLLEEKLGRALNEVNSNKLLARDLTQERDDLRRLLEVKVESVKNLKHELHVTQETLNTSKTEASTLSKQLEQSRKSCQELTSEISRIQAVFAEARESLKKQVKEARQSSEALSSELASVKKVLEKTEEKLRTVSDELVVAIKSQESLKKELVDVYKKEEQTENELKEQRNLVSSLSIELEASRKQILKDKEARQSLETDLEEATKSLDEVNKNVLMLSGELDMANSKISSLEADKELLFNSLVQQRNITKEAQENVEDADNLIMKLGKERESLKQRGNYLEGELASAKGEILRLRTQIKASKNPVNDVPQNKSDEVEGNPAVVVKRRRRRKSNSSSETSE